MNLDYYIYKMNFLTHLIAFIIGIIRFRSFSKELRLFYYFVLFGAFSDIFLRIYMSYGFKNSLWYGHFYIPVSFFFIALFYIQLLKGFLKTSIIVVFMVLFPVFSILNLAFFQGFYEYPNILSAVDAIVLILFSVAYFGRVMLEAKIEKLFQEPLIWINLAILIYFSGNFVFHALFNYSLSVSFDFAMLTVTFLSVMNLLFYGLITVGFLKIKKHHYSI